MGTKETKRITAIFVGGEMDPRHYDDLKSARDLYPANVSVTSQTPQSVPNILSYSPLSKDSFYNTTPQLIRQHGSNGMLQFVQFGHGSHYLDKPELILNPSSFWSYLDYDGISGEALPNLFEKNIPDLSNPPYLAIILGGCFSGGFGKYFLESKATPDFFYGNSPPQTVGFQGLQYFLDANAQNADINRDGIVTLRERAIHQMNSDNPLAVLFSKRGSPDLDIAGNVANKPYFSKTVETIATHEELISQIKSLRFGEQAVVLLEGTDEATPQISEWFAKEAVNGDGFYRFLKIKTNPQSAEFFGTEGKTMVFVTGPNLRFHGVALKADMPIGDQIPHILAEANPLWSLKDWRDKITKEIPIATSVLQGYTKYLNENPSVQKVEALLASKNESDQLEGLKLADLMMSSGFRENFRPLLFVNFYNRLKAEKTKPSLDTLVALTQILGSFYDPAIGEVQLAVIREGLDNYGAKYQERVGNVASIPVPSLMKDLYSGDATAQMRALSILELTNANFTVDLPFLNFVTSKTMPTEVKPAISSYLDRHLPYVESEVLQKCIEQFHLQEDAETKAILLQILVKYADEPEVKSIQNKVAELATSQNTFLQKAAANLLAEIKRKEAMRAVNLKAEKKSALDEETWAALSRNVQAMARSEEGRWTGGFLLGVSGIFQKGILTDGKRTLSLGIQPTLDVTSHWEHNWVTILPSISGLVDFKMSSDYGHHSHITVAGGYAARYMPARNTSDVVHGWMGELTFWDHGYRDNAGISLRYFSFPKEHDQILMFGAKLILTK